MRDEDKAKERLLAQPGEPRRGTSGPKEPEIDGHQSMRSFDHRDAILKALATSTKQFLYVTSFEEGIQEMLRLLGEAAEVSRVYVFENHLGEDGTSLTSQRYEWVAPGIEPTLGNRDLQNASWMAAGMWRWVEIMRQRGTVCGHVRDLPSNEQRVLSSQNIQSIVAVPVFVELEWWGFIGFDECATERTWSEAEIEVLNASAGILGGLIKRLWLEEALRDHQERLEMLVEEQTEELRDSNRSLRAEIAERRCVEETLRKSEEQYRSFFEECPIALWEIDASYVKEFTDQLRSSGVRDLKAYFVDHQEDASRCRRRVKLVAINKASLELFEVSSKKALLRSVRRIVPNEAYPPFAEGILAVGEGRTSFEREVITYTLTGKRKHLLYRWSVAPGHEKTYSKLLLSIVDITDRVQLEQELLKAQKLESLGVLAGGIAHDFNNLLTAISTNISMARMYGNLEDDILEMLSDAEKACSRSRNLTQQLLAFGKGGKPITRTVSVRKLLIDTVEFALSGSNAKSEYCTPEDLWLISVDEGQLGQVFHNLALNADQAMPRGGIIRISAENMLVEQDDKIPLKEGKYVRVSVADEGIGISRQYLERVFDPFFTTKQKGSGLGLTSCFAIMKNHGGYIRLDSEVDRGTTVEVYIPASDEVLEQEEIENAKAMKGEGRILLIDDEEAIRRSAGEMLRRFGYDVKLAKDGSEGIQFYRQATESGLPFDAVILDLTIRGGKGGREVIQQLLKIDRGANVVASSGYSDDPVMSNFKKYGFCGCISKPYGVDEVGKVLRRVISRGEGEPSRVAPSCAGGYPG